MRSPSSLAPKSSCAHLLWPLRIFLGLFLGTTTMFGALVPLESPFGIDEIKNAKLTQALALLKEAKLEEARAATEEFLKADPRSAPGHEILGIVLVLQGEIDAGLAELEKAVAIDPKQSTALTKIGDVHMSRGDQAKAKGYFLQTIALNPADRHAHQRLGLIFEEEKDLPQAIVHFEKGLVGTPPEYIGIKTNLGRLYNRARLFRNTVRLLDPVLDDKTENPIAHIVLGTAFLGLKKPDEALESFERAEKFSDHPAGMPLAFGIAYRNAGQLKKSEQELLRAMEQDPESSMALLQMAETLVAMKRLPEAMKYFTRAAEDADTRILATARMAETHLDHGQTKEALALYLQLKEDPAPKLFVFVGLSKVYLASDRLEDAEKVLTEATERFPENPESHFRLGMHLALVRKYDPAAVSLAQARTLSPADPRVQKALSLVALRRGDLPTALSEAERLLKLVPGSRDDQFYLATLLEKSDRDEDARALYEQILDTKPDHISSLNNLAQLLMRTGDTEAAIKLANQAVLLAKDNPTVLDTHGWILFQADQAAKGLPSLEKAAASPHASPTHHYHLAVVSAQLGNKDQAARALTAALESGQDFPEKKEAQTLAEKLGKTE